MFDSVGGRSFHVAIKSIAAACVVWFIVRSLFNTIAFTQLAYPGEEWTGIVGGLFIQFSPNVFFALASYSNDPIWKGVWLVLGFGFSGIDIGTNIGDRRNSQYVLTMTGQATPVGTLISPEAAQWASYLGYAMDVAVAGFEELLATFVGAIVRDVRSLYEMTGKERYMPSWLTVVEDAAARSRGGSVDRPHNNKQHQNQNHGKQQNNHNNQPKHNQQHQGNRQMDRAAIDELLNRRPGDNGRDFVQRIDDRR